MTLPAFALEVPEDLAEAIDLLERHGDDAALYMGGTELLLILKLGFATLDVLVDGKRLAELRGIDARDELLDIGAGCTHREIAASALVRETLPALASLAGDVANQRVRNVGTLGGNLCFAEPHSDPATLLLALDASVQLASSDGLRELELDSFLVGPLETARANAEILTRIHVPRPDPDARVAFERIVFNERPVANAALHLAGADVRIAVGAVGARPVRVPEAEALVRDGESPSAVAAAVGEAVEPYEDLYGSREYKRHLAGVAVTRCLAAADAA